MFKRFLLLLFCSISGTSAVLFFFWQQTSQLPEWYQKAHTQYTNPSVTSSTPPQTELPQQTQQAQKQVLHKISDYLKGSNAKGEVQLDAQEVNALIVSGITQRTDIHQFAQAVVSTKTQIENGKISAGAVIDFRAIPLNKLPVNEQAALSQLLSTVPILKYRPIYIEIEGKPVIRNKQVNLDDTTRIKLGNLSFSVSDLSQRFGFSQERFNQKVAQQLNNLPVEVEDVEVVGDRLVLRGSAGNRKG